MNIENTAEKYEYLNSNKIIKKQKIAARRHDAFKLLHVTALKMCKLLNNMNYF